MALSLMDYNEYATTPKSTRNMRDSPFFDPSFWNTDFEKRKEVRKKELTINLGDIDIIHWEDGGGGGAGGGDDEEKLFCHTPMEHKGGKLVRRAGSRRRTGTLANIDEDIDRQQIVVNHAATMTRMKFQKFVARELFLHDLDQVFDPGHLRR